MAWLLDTNVLSERYKQCTSRNDYRRVADGFWNHRGGIAEGHRARD